MNRVRTFGLYLSFVFIAWAALTCKDEVEGPQLGELVFPDSNVSYSKHVQPLFDRGCGSQSTACHSSETYDAHGGYSLDTYENATHRVGIIVRGNPDASLLIGTMEGRTAPKMPPFGSTPLNADQIKGMRTWVKEGARGDN